MVIFWPIHSIESNISYKKKNCCRSWFIWILKYKRCRKIYKNTINKITRAGIAKHDTRVSKTAIFNTILDKFITLNVVIIVFTATQWNPKINIKSRHIHYGWLSFGFVGNCVLRILVLKIIGSWVRNFMGLCHSNKISFLNCKWQIPRCWNCYFVAEW